MRYIKTFEDKIDRIYRVGDVVVYEHKNEEERIGTIFNTSSRMIAIENKYPKENFSFTIKIDHVFDFQILRLATSDDYEEFELKSKAEIYNL